MRWGGPYLGLLSGYWVAVGITGGGGGIRLVVVVGVQVLDWQFPPPLGIAFSSSMENTFSRIVTIGGILGVLAMLGLFSVLPIDIIIQSKNNNTHLASNTIVIFIFIAVIVLFILVLQFNRITTHKRNIDSIPSYCIPITSADIGTSTATYVTPSRHPRTIASAASG